MPDAVDTFPSFLKNGGIIQISIRFTPCIQPVSSAENSTEATALAPLSRNKPKAAIAPTAKIIHAQPTGFFSCPPYILDAI